MAMHPETTRRRHRLAASLACLGIFVLLLAVGAVWLAIASPVAGAAFGLQILSIPFFRLSTKLRRKPKARKTSKTATRASYAVPGQRIAELDTSPPPDPERHSEWCVRCQLRERREPLSGVRPG
jgi:hypothetical protein